MDGGSAGTLNTCIRARNAPKGWMETSYVLKNGTRVKVIAFTSPDCADGYRRERAMTVPGVDGLDFVYLPLF